MSNHPKDPNFSYLTPDVNGYVPDTSLLGSRLLHLGNGKTYEILGFCWLGESDEWGFRHIAIDGGPECCRPISHLDGTRSNGEPRYSKI